MFIGGPSDQTIGSLSDARGSEKQIFTWVFNLGGHMGLADLLNHRFSLELEQDLMLHANKNAKLRNWDETGDKLFLVDEEKESLVHKLDDQHKLWALYLLLLLIWSIWDGISLIFYSTFWYFVVKLRKVHFLILPSKVFFYKTVKCAAVPGSFTRKCHLWAWTLKPEANVSKDARDTFLNACDIYVEMQEEDYG